MAQTSTPDKELGTMPAQAEVIAALEPEQLSSAKTHHYSRRGLTGAQKTVLWILRLYVLFMMATVAYQIFAGK